MDGSYWKELIRPAMAGHRWLMATLVAVAAGPLLDLLDDYGAEQPFILAGLVGVGDPPDPERAETVILGTGGATMVQGTRAFHAALRDLSPDVLARIDAWDPDRSARVIEGFLPSNETVAGRRLYGGRRPEWQALEDKIAATALWDAAGVRQAPFEIVPVDQEALLAAHRRLDRGSGTVWVGDNRDGWHGGAEVLRWIRRPNEAAEAARFLGEQCDVARVMPFLEGVPCSVHGIVFDDYVAALRPAEMVTMRRAASSSLQYCGIANYWDPPPADAEYMRDVVRRVGAHLDRTVGYRGAFGIDGVLTADGFLPTELNARYSPGLMLQSAPVDDLPLGMVNRTIIAGEPFDFRPCDLEALLLDATLENRRSRVLYPVGDRRVDETTTQPIVFAPEGVRVAHEGEEPHGELALGPAPMGAIVFCSLEQAHVPIGPSVAPKVIPAIQLAGELWDIDVGELVAAV